MRFTSLLGWILIVAAFIAAAAETVAHTVPGVRGMVISAYDLWYTLWPKSLVITRIIVERDFHALIWDPLLVAVLQFPAWLLLGGPGVALAWYFRSPRPKSEGIEDDSIFVYDRLVEAAERDNLLEEPPLEYPYDPPAVPLVEDSLEDDFDPSGEIQAPDDGPYEPGGDGDGRA